MTHPAIFSFFAGAGFLDLGFEQSGFEIVYVNECHEPFLNAYKHARSVLGIAAPRFGAEEVSIETIDRDALEKNMLAVEAEGNLVGFIGGPPCPDFSVGGKKSRS